MARNADKPSFTPFAHLALDVLERADRAQLLRLARSFIRVEEIIDSVHDLDHLLELIMEESQQALNAECSSLLLYDKTTDSLYFEVALGPKGEQVKQIQLSLDAPSIAAICARQRAPYNIPDVTLDPNWNASVDQITEFTTQSILAVPMLRQDRLIGIIEVLNRRDGKPFSESDINTLLILAGLAAIALENAQLFQQNLQAERLAALGQAVAGISHYTKNILTGLKGSITLIEAALENKEYAILERAVMVLKRSSNRISNLVRDMLSFSRGEKADSLPINANQICRETVEMLSDSITAKCIDLQADYQPDIPTLYGDPEIIERILANLLTNAADAIYDRKQLEPNHEGIIKYQTRYEDGVLEILVEDNGVGIKPANAGKIWNAFFTTKGTAGTGLGLAVSRKLAEDCGGRLELISTAGKPGACFVLKLPAEVVED